mmetsp:Transcript_67545/g.213839  ORF Transcript_67545/g.213839 Transcript_67545/m.213839 type:complete len:202 (+) Transcript_67545:771-1376(+)
MTVSYSPVRSEPLPYGPSTLSTTGVGATRASPFSIMRRCAGGSTVTPRAITSGTAEGETFSHTAWDLTPSSTSSTLATPAGAMELRLRPGLPPTGSSAAESRTPLREGAAAEERRAAGGSSNITSFSWSGLRRSRRPWVQSPRLGGEGAFYRRMSWESQCNCGFESLSSYQRMCTLTRSSSGAEVMVKGCHSCWESVGQLM